MKIEEDAKDVARIMAKRSKLRFRHGAVIVKNSKIIAAGWNYILGVRDRVGARSPNNEDVFSVHAEIDAISRTNIRALGSAVAVLYSERNGRPRCSRPCPNCWKILRKLGFKRVIYSTSAGWEKELIQ